MRMTDQKIRKAFVNRTESNTKTKSSNLEQAPGLPLFLASIWFSSLVKAGQNHFFCLSLLGLYFLVTAISR